MKKLILLSVVGLLCLNLKATAQINNAGISIGSAVPEVTITQITNYKDTKVKLSSFKGKAVIIDFWATWCSPCVAMIPKLEALQKEFKDQITIISVTEQDRKTVQTFLSNFVKKNKVRYSLIDVTDDQVLHTLFPHSSIPTLVWIDAKGILQAITDFQPLDKEHINSFLVNGNLKNLIVKQYTPLIPYDPQKPLFLTGNAFPAPKIYFHSLLTAYKPGLTGGYAIRQDSMKNLLITFRNTTLRNMFSVAYSEAGLVINKTNLFIESRDSTRFTTRLITDAYVNWLKSGNGYCYELMVGHEQAKQANQYMQQDLARYFPQYEAKIETRDNPCLIVEQITKMKLPISKETLLHLEIGPFGYKLRNANIKELCYRLNAAQRTPFHISDETGLTSRLDLDLHSTVYELDKLNAELNAYGLRVRHTTRPSKVLVIRDRPSTPDQ